MTHASFPAPAVHAAATAVHARLSAKVAAEGVRAVNHEALYQAQYLARFAQAVGDGAVSLDLDDFNLLSDDMTGPVVATDPAVDVPA